MGYIDRMRGAVQRCGPEERDELLDFRRRMFGEGSRQTDPEGLAWLFDRNPCADPHRPELWIARRAALVVGHQAGVCAVVKVGAEQRRAVWAVDLVVAPEWRLRGVAPALMEAQAAASPLTLAVNVNDTARKAYLRAGWRDIAGLPAYLWPLAPGRILTAGGAARGDRHPVLRRIAAAAAIAAEPLVARFGRLLAGRSISSRPVAGRLALEPVAAFDRRADAVWDAASPAYPVIARRDWRWLRWRFDDGPDRETVRRFYLTRDGAALGYAVLRCESWKGRRLTVLVDYLAAPELVPALFRRCLRIACDDGSCGLLCRTLNPRADARLRALGFLRLTRHLFPLVRLMAWIPGADVAAELLGDPCGWFLTSGDSDLGHESLDGAPRS